MFQSTGFKDALQQHVIQFLRASWNKASKCYMKVEVWGQQATFGASKQPYFKAQNPKFWI